MTNAAPRDWKTCLHEAGHAMAFLAVGDRARVVEVVIDDAGNGSVYAQHKGRFASASLCGYAAEMHDQYGLRWKPKAAAFELNMELEDVRRAAEQLGSDDPAKLLEAWNKAAEAVAHYWPEITTIAKLLQLKGRLSGEALELLWRGMRKKRANRKAG